MVIIMYREKQLQCIQARCAQLVSTIAQEVDILTRYLSVPGELHSLAELKFQLEFHGGKSVCTAMANAPNFPHAT